MCHTKIVTCSGITPNAFILKNGVTLVVDHVPTVETASVRVLFKVGGRDEVIQHSGISHFLEHVNFKGTQKRTAKEIAEEFDMVGGFLNAYTGYERTVYQAKVLKGDLELGIDMLSDLVQHSVYDPNELDKEKKVVLQEIADYEDSPEDKAFDLFQKQVFQHHQLGWSILGTAESLNSISREDVQEYVRHHYTANNTIIGVSGNIDILQVGECVERYFNNLLPNTTKGLYQKPEYYGGEVCFEKDIEQVHIVLGFIGIAYKDPQYYHYQLLSVIAGGGMSSRLFQEIREKRGLAYSVSAFSSHNSDSGIFGTYAATDASAANEVADVTIQQFHEMASSITEAELKRAKAQVKSSLLMACESTSSRAEKIISDYAIFGRFISLEEIMKQIDAISAIDLQVIVRQLLDSTKVYKPTVAIVGRVKGLQVYDTVLKRIAGG